MSSANSRPKLPVVMVTWTTGVCVSVVGTINKHLLWEEQWCITPCAHCAHTPTNDGSDRNTKDIIQPEILIENFLRFWSKQNFSWWRLEPKSFSFQHHMFLLYQNVLVLEIRTKKMFSFQNNTFPIRGCCTLLLWITFSNVVGDKRTIQWVRL